MKINRAYIITLLLLVVIPSFLQAQICSQDKTTIVFVNGMFGEQFNDGTNTASRYEKLLQDELKDNASLRDLSFDHAFNPSHFDGVGETVKVLQQSMISANQVEDHK